MARILLADDDEDMVEICSRLLPRRGHTLITANNAADAVALAESGRPDLILMDMRMPVSPTGDVKDSAGLDAVIAIKSKPELKPIPIIALTGHMMTMFRTAIIDAGCVDMMAKPIENFAHLTDAIERALKEAAKT
jgi:two-component system cell cycle response regulator DivK